MSTPEFGPGGYLPPKAAKRARKIILREQMGFGWPAAAVGAALVVIVAGVFFLQRGGPPTAPYVAVAPLGQIPSGGTEVVPAEGVQVLIVRAGGAVRVFLVDRQDITWCAQSQRLEASDAAWTPDGRRSYGDGPSLQPAPSLVYDGIVYADVTADQPPPAPAPGTAAPLCAN